MCSGLLCVVEIEQQAPEHAVEWKVLVPVALFPIESRFSANFVGFQTHDFACSLLIKLLRDTPLADCGLRTGPKERGVIEELVVGTTLPDSNPDGEVRHEAAKGGDLGDAKLDVSDGRGEVFILANGVPRDGHASKSTALFLLLL